MPVLATISYEQQPTFAVPRGYVVLFGVGWWANTLLIQAGNPSVFQEVPFGGYRVVLRWKPWFYAFDLRRVPLGELLEDLYALAPDSTTPINCGAVQMGYRIVEEWATSAIVLSFTPSDGYYWFQRFPPAPADYWNKQPDLAPASPFHVP